MKASKARQVEKGRRLGIMINLILISDTLGAMSDQHPACMMTTKKLAARRQPAGVGNGVRVR